MNNPERNNGAAANDNSQPKVTPTGIPRAGPLALPAESVLKSLQVKAELAKLGQPPRAYVEKLQMPAEEGEMHVDEGLANSQRLALTERFEKIQGARPGPLPNTENAGNNNNGGNGGQRNKKTLGQRSQPRNNARSRRYNR